MPKRMISHVLDGRGLVTASKDMSVRAACRLMTERNIGALLVSRMSRSPVSSPSAMPSTRYCRPDSTPRRRILSR